MSRTARNYSKTAESSSWLKRVAGVGRDRNEHSVGDPAWGLRVRKTWWVGLGAPMQREKSTDGQKARMDVAYHRHVTAGCAYHEFAVFSKTVYVVGDELPSVWSDSVLQL